MLSTAQIISPTLSLDAKTIAGPDQLFNVYLHRGIGPVVVGLGSLPQTINSVEAPAGWFEHAERKFLELENNLNIRFNLVTEQSQADLSFFVDSEIVTDSDSVVTYGMLVSNRDPVTRRQWSEIFFNGPRLSEESQSFPSFLFNHELLHALGLEHPFDDSDGDFYKSTDPQLSATTDETVMSYRRPEDGQWPQTITDTDYQALTQIWGLRLPTRVYRFYQVSSGKHLYTSNSQEIDALTGNPLSGYVNEGIAYEVAKSADIDLFRFYQPRTGLHFYSASTQERDFIVGNLNDDYVYEGVAYKVFQASTAPAGSTPVVRYYDPGSSVHFYTASVEEQAQLPFSQPDWINEGVAWYV